MKVGDAIADILRREGVDLLFGYPVNHLIEFAAKAGDPPHHRSPGTRRPAHGRCHLAAQFRPQHRRLLHAARTGHRERLWRRRAMLRRIGPGAGVADGLPAAPVADQPELQSRDQHGVGHQIGRERSRSPPNCRTSCAAPSRSCATAAAARCWSRSLPTSSTRRSPSRSTTSPRSAHAPAPIQRTCAVRRQLLAGAERPVIYAGQGVHYARAWPRAARTGRNAGRAGADQPWRARAPSPRTIRCRWARAASPIPRRCITSCTAPT